ncbi:protein tyrosine phosphatase [Arthrobacter sp. B10-11]|uniref:protein tyrosine phosphatase n=1 Tax=Arthrobacter sp. B10-11 TaxID=3081160 RepID=UPI0029531D09|nr:protein tyrosine phosphatase [Arthrobacter sp. B10-11]MDV8148770.1 protein tyrosine phosphatase [Arthrobacter sp. B10-11]
MSLFTIFATSKVAASALAAGTLAVGGTGAAAFAGALPSDIQQSAHELLGAPAPHVGGVSETAASGAAEASASATPSASADAAGSVDGEDASAEASAAAAGPDATGPAAYGLCTAFTKGGLEASSTAFKSLAIAAEGEANIGSYCDDVVAAGNAGANAAAKADGNEAEVAGNGNAAVDVEAPEVPEAPELPTQAAVPAAPEIPAEVPTELPELPTSAGRP